MYNENDPVNFNLMLYLWGQVKEALTLDLTTIPDEQRIKQQNTIDELKKNVGAS